MTEASEASALTESTEALRSSVEQYRNLFASINVGFCVIEMLFDDEKQPVDYRFLEFNHAFERHTGLRNAVGKTARELVPDLDDFWFRTYGSVALTGESVRFENHAPAMNRSFDVYALRVGSAKERRIALLFTDITERVQAAVTLQAKSDEVTSILESVTEAFFALDGEWRFTYVNTEAERVLSRKREDLLGRSIWDEFPAAVGSEFERQYRRAARERVTVAFQPYYPPPLDAWYDVRAYPALSGTGISVYFRNINEERQRDKERENLIAEQQRLVAELEHANARQRSSLQQSEERFRVLVEGVQDYAIFMLDPDGIVTTWNAGAERFKGYREEEILGQHFSRFYTEEDIARRHPWNELEIAAREGRYEEEGWRVRKDGSRFWANVVITALRDKEGELRGFAKVTRDVTERRLSEQTRVATEALKQQRQFLKDVLSSVTQGRLLLCDERSDLPAPLASDVADEPVPLIKEAMKAVRRCATNAAARARLPLDRTQDLVTAASECAMNAVQHAGGGTATVYNDATAGRVQVWVEDTGKGIDLSSLPRVTLEPGFGTGGGGIGHGFSLMITCCDRVYLLTGPSGTTVVLEQEQTLPTPAWIK